MRLLVLALLIAGPVFAKGKPKHPDSTVCVGLKENPQKIAICVEHVWYMDEFHAVFENMTDLSLGTCTVRFVLHHGSVIVEALTAYTPTQVGPHERQLIQTEQYPAAFQPMSDVRLSCSAIPGGEVTVALEWPVFPSLIDGWVYARKMGYK